MPPTNQPQPAAAMHSNGYTLNELLDQAVAKLGPLKRHVFTRRLRNRQYREDTLAELQLKLSEDSRATTLFGTTISMTANEFSPFSTKIQLDPDKLKQILDLLLEYLPKIFELIAGLFGAIAFLLITFAPSLASAQCRPDMPCWNQRQVNYLSTSQYAPVTYAAPVCYVPAQQQYMPAPAPMPQPQVRYAPPQPNYVQNQPTPAPQINFVGCDECGGAQQSSPCNCGDPGCNCGAPVQRSYGSTGSVAPSSSTGSMALVSYVVSPAPYASYSSSGSQTVQSYGSTGSQAAYGAYGDGVNVEVNNYVTRRRPAPIAAAIYNSATYHSNGSGRSLADHLARDHGVAGAYSMSPTEQEAAHAAAHAGGAGLFSSRRGPVRRFLFGG